MKTVEELIADVRVAAAKKKEADVNAAQASVRSEVAQHARWAAQKELDEAREALLDAAEGKGT